jgi:hypothetical protein
LFVRERADAKYVAEFAEQIRSCFPACPAKEAESIANHACRKYSGRVGRSAAAKEFDEEVLELAVQARVRHNHTEHDQLLAAGWDRHNARHAVRSQVEDVLERWRGNDG